MNEVKSNAELNIQQLARERLEEREYGYSELCKVLGMKAYKSGNGGQKAQLNEIAKAREIEEVPGVWRGRSVTRYKIGKVKEYIPTISLDGKRGTKISSEKKSMYLYMLEFLDSLATEGTHAEYSKEDGCWKVTLTNNSLFKGLQVVNRNNYDVALCDPKYFCQHLGVNEDVLSEVMGSITSNNSITVSKMLEKLEQLDLIYYVKTAMIGKNELLLNEDSYELSNNKDVIREANFRENSKIRKIKRKILNDMNMIDERDVYVKGERVKFYNKLRSQLQSEMGIDYYCPVYSISYDKENIVEFIEMLKRNPDIDFNLERTSKKFLDNMKRNCKNRREKVLNNRPVKMTPKKAARLLDCYEEHSEKVLDNLHISSNNIPKKLSV